MRRFDSAVRVLGTLLAISFAGSSQLLAADQAIFGRKLLIRNPPSGAATNKVVHLGKDPSITVGTAGSAGDPQCSGAGGGGTSSLRVAASGGAGDITIPLPCAGWTTNGTNSLCRYRDTSGATCTLVLVKNGALAKAVCKGSQVAIDLNGGMSPTTVVTTLNTEQYCTEFGGTVVKDGSDDKTFLRKDALAPGSCPTISITTTTSTILTSTTLTVCCVFMSGCSGGLTAASCDLADGVPGAFGTVCDGTGNCVAPPGTPGDCCELSGLCVEPRAPSPCASAGGTYHPSAVCLASGACSP